jgi:WD40 repeat protein
MGVIYRARDLTLNRVVALKLMLAGDFADAREVKRFRTEAEAAARLEHPNIVPIYEFGELEGRPFLSMRFVEGANLADRLGGKAMNARPAALLMRTLARAIHYAHQRGVLHRDLKPANVLLDSDGQPHVTDFGLAKCLDSSDGVTLSGAMLGSPNYMSPEQAAGHPDRLTTAADIYSLGAILYELLTGRPPFRADTPLETMRKVMDEAPPAPHTIQKSTDPELETICLKCMEKEPDRRYGSAEALAEDLERWLRREPIQARPVGTLRRLGKWTQRKPRTAVLLLLCGLAILAFLVGQTVMSVRLSRANTKVKVAIADLTRSLYEVQWRQADDAARGDEMGEAIAWFSHFLRENPSNADAAARLLSLLSSCNFPVLLLPPLVHESPVIAMDFSQVGDRLATATYGGTARLWNIESGKMELELTHPEPLTDCLFCGENDLRLLTVSSEPKARLWDLGTHRLMSAFALGPKNTSHTWRGVRPTRDGRLIALNVKSNVINILNAASGTWVEPALIMPTAISKFAMSADGSKVAIASDSEVRLWKSGSEQPLSAPVELHAPPQALCFSDNGLWLACLCQNKIWVMNTETGARGREFAADAASISFLGRTDRLITVSAQLGLLDARTGKECGSPFGAAEFNAQWHGDLLFSSRDLWSYLPSTLRLLDPVSGHFQAESFIHDGPFCAAKLRRDGRVVATASQDRLVRLWSADMKRAEPLILLLGGSVYEAQWSPSGDRILSTSVVGSNARMQLWDARTGQALCSPQPLDGTGYFAQWSPDGMRVATAGEKSAIIWDAQTGRALSPRLHEGGSLIYCVFSPDGKLLATAAEDHTVRVWDGHTGRAIGAPLVHSHVPLKISFSSDGRRLATGGMDGTIHVWSVPEGKLILGRLRHRGVCWVAAFSPDDRWIVSASSDSTAQLWDAATGQPALPPFRHEAPVWWASFSPDGRAIATCTESGMARVWDTAIGQLLSEPMHQPGKVWYVKWSPDGRFLATTCTDGSARVWDAKTGHLVTEPFVHQGEVRRAEFSPDGRRLLTASFDGTVKVWDLALLRPPLPVPDWLPMLAESLGGKRLGPKDSLESVPGDAFQLARKRVEQYGTNDYYGHWGHWLLRERFERPVKPFRPQ